MNSRGAGLTTEQQLSAVGVHDALSAFLAERAGFSAVYITGYGLEATQLAAPDMGLMTLAEVAQQAGRIVDATNVPVICDVDTGFGGVNNVWRTVRELDKAGVSAIQIEDQTNPKRCPYVGGRKIVPRDEGIGRIGAAVDARSNESDLKIIGRSDSDSVSFDELVTRANLYLEAGADIALPILLEVDGKPLSTMHPDEQMSWYVRLADEVDGPLVCLDPPPQHTQEDMLKAGFNWVIHPLNLLQAYTNNAMNFLSSLATHGTAEEFFKVNEPKVTADRQLLDMLDLQSYLNREKRFDPAASEQ